MRSGAFGLGAWCGGCGLPLSGGQRCYLRARAKNHRRLERQRWYEHWEHVRTEQCLCKFDKPAKWHETLALLLYTLWRLPAGCSGQSVHQDKRIAILLQLTIWQSRSLGLKRNTFGVRWTSTPPDGKSAGALSGSQTIGRLRHEMFFAARNRHQSGTAGRPALGQQCERLSSVSGCPSSDGAR